MINESGKRVEIIKIFNKIKMIMSRTSVEEEKKFNILESLTYLDLCESSPGNKVPLYAASLLKEKKVNYFLFIQI